ncbi:MAG TPA: SDR family oxidoreductase [Microthrixaceae bacterium]|nr:SDR family oxidoreductase [Microthrixaceae bacterium]
MMLEGLTAMVTGVGPGMGRDISLGLAREGADVILVARSDKTVPSVVEEIEALGRRGIPIYGNIADAEDCLRIAAEANAAIGRLPSSDDPAEPRTGLDILVNSAFHGGEHVRFEDADLKRWHRPVNINYFGTLQLTQAMLPLLKVASARTGDARIVMINTMSIHHIESGAGSYAGSKAALGAVTKTLATELGEYGIRVNSVHPGYIWGDSVKIYFEWQAKDRGGDTTWQDIYDERAAETALGYLPHSSEISGAVVFFASPLAKCVTGTALPVNSGHWMPPSA